MAKKRSLNLDQQQEFVQSVVDSVPGQTYTRKSKWALIMQSRYRHARQARRENAELRKVKTYFGRVFRDLDRKTRDIRRSQKLTELLELAYRLFKQKKDDKNKIYSLHAPEMECIAKGKAHKKYEFGCKVSVVTSSQGNLWQLNQKK